MYYVDESGVYEVSTKSLGELVCKVVTITPIIRRPTTLELQAGDYILKKRCFDDEAQAKLIFSIIIDALYGAFIELRDSGTKALNDYCETQLSSLRNQKV